MNPEHISFAFCFSFPINSIMLLFLCAQDSLVQGCIGKSAWGRTCCKSRHRCGLKHMNATRLQEVDGSIEYFCVAIIPIFVQTYECLGNSCCDLPLVEASLFHGFYAKV